MKFEKKFYIFIFFYFRIIYFIDFLNKKKLIKVEDIIYIIFHIYDLLYTLSIDVSLTPNQLYINSR